MSENYQFLVNMPKTDKNSAIVGPLYRFKTHAHPGFTSIFILFLARFCAFFNFQTHSRTPGRNKAGLAIPAYIKDSGV